MSTALRAGLWIDDVALKPYTAIDSVHTDPIEPMPVHEHHQLLDAFTPETIDAVLAAAGPGTASQQFLVELRQLGGAFAVEGPHPSVFHPRHGSYSVLAVGRRLFATSPSATAALFIGLAQETRGDVAGALASYRQGLRLAPADSALAARAAVLAPRG